MSAAQQFDGGWVMVSERLPNDGQSVAFVVDCKNQNWDHLHGMVLGGVFRAGTSGGFSVPGLTVKASHWQPMFAAPVEHALDTPAPETAEQAFERGRQQGREQERALWELAKIGQEIEAAQDDEVWVHSELAHLREMADKLIDSPEAEDPRISELRDVLGPSVPEHLECMGCRWEWQEALRILGIQAAANGIQGTP